MGLIAGRYGVRRAEVIQLNSQISNPNLIRPGQKLRVCPRIPPRKQRKIEHEIVAAEKADSLASKQAAGRKATGLMVGLLSSLMRRRMLDELRSDGGDPERWANAIEMLSTTEARIEANVNRKMALAGLVADLVDELSRAGAVQ